MNTRPDSATGSRRGEPLTLLLAALGGQGGGVLADWIGTAARAQGLRVQATSTPGVSQRTGATTYYVELAAMPEGAALPPVLALAAVPGCVDVLVCAELLEAARMLERGMCTPGRTTVIASTHRVYTTHEKMDAGDGRFDDQRIVAAVHALARRALLFDLDAVGRRNGAAISAALFGALAGSGTVPLPRSACEDAIRAAGKGVAPSLAAFAEAYERSAQASDEPRADTGAMPVDGVPAETALPPALAPRVAALPQCVAAFARAGALRSLSYQDLRYAARYLDRVEDVVRAESGADGPEASYGVAREVARFLALWMCYGDVIRVAAQKASASRLERIRREARARGGDIMRVHDLFRPSVPEIAAILPRRLGEWLERRAGGPGRAPSAGRGFSLQTSAPGGALALRIAAALRPLRPYSLRFAREQEAIADWLAAVTAALAIGGHGAAELALELARLPRLIKGYGATQVGGTTEFRRILNKYRAGSGSDPAHVAEALRAAVRTALAITDPPRPAVQGAATRPQRVVWRRPAPP